MEPPSLPSSVFCAMPQAPSVRERSRITKALAFAWCLVALLTLSGPAKAVADPDRHTGMRSNADLVFPIIAWNIVSPRHHKTDTEDLFILMKDAGFTVAGFVPTEALDDVHSAGLKAIVYDDTLSAMIRGAIPGSAPDKSMVDRLTKVVAETAEHPATLGYFLTDEPSGNMFHTLGAIVDLLEEKAPGKLPYISYFPSYADAKALGETRFSDYVSNAFVVAKSWFFSDCFYALYQDGVQRSGYWYDLSARREAALAAGRPVLQTVLCTAHFRYAEPTEATLRWQVYTGLTYGAKGVQYFTFLNAYQGNYRLAPLDGFGRKTPTYDMVRRINEGLHRLGPVVSRLTSSRVYFVGQSPEGQPGADQTSLVQSFQNPFDALVGEFSDTERNTYVMITNLSLDASEHCAPVYRDKAVSVEKLCQYRGTWVPFADEQVWLAPGEGVLLRVNLGTSKR